MSALAQELHAFLKGRNRSATPRSRHPPRWNQTTWGVAGCCLCYENTWKTWPFYVGSLLGTNCKSATHNPCIQRFKLPTHFQGSYFCKPLTTRFQWCIVYFTARDPQALHALGSCAVNPIRHWKRVLTTTYYIYCIFTQRLKLLFSGLERCGVYLRVATIWGNVKNMASQVDEAFHFNSIVHGHHVYNEAFWLDSIVSVDSVLGLRFCLLPWPFPVLRTVSSHSQLSSLCPWRLNAAFIRGTLYTILLRSLLSAPSIQGQPLNGVRRLFKQIQYICFSKR